MASIGPTAHYTGHVWARHGLSHPALSTGLGRALHLAAAAPQLAATLDPARGLAIVTEGLLSAPNTRPVSRSV